MVEHGTARGNHTPFRGSRRLRGASSPQARVYTSSHNFLDEQIYTLILAARSATNQLLNMARRNHIKSIETRSKHLRYQYPKLRQPNIRHHYLLRLRIGYFFFIASSRSTSTTTTSSASMTRSHRTYFAFYVY